MLYRYAQFKGYDTAQGGMAIREVCGLRADLRLRCGGYDLGRQHRAPQRRGQQHPGAPVPGHPGPGGYDPPAVHQKHCPINLAAKRCGQPDGCPHRSRSMQKEWRRMFRRQTAWTSKPSPACCAITAPIHPGHLRPRDHRRPAAGSGQTGQCPIGCILMVSGHFRPVCSGRHPFRHRLNALFPGTPSRTVAENVASAAIGGAPASLPHWMVWCTVNKDKKSTQAAEGTGRDWPRSGCRTLPHGENGDFESER